MDKTELFIKQCDCPEIQGQWKLREGDYTSAPPGVVGIRYISEDDKYYSHKKIKAIKESNTWLPMQHQIQEMIGFKYAGPGYVRELWDFTLDESEVRAYDSFEQLWLAFYFHKKHSKTWDSKKEKWVKNNA